MRWIMLLLSIGCASSPNGDQNGSPDSGTPHTGDGELPITYPSGDRVLLYYGHQGSEEASTGKAGFEEVDIHLQATLGLSLDHRNYIPDDLSPYRMIGLIGVGTQGDAVFAPSEVLSLVAAMEDGTRIVVFADREHCRTETVSNLLEELGVSLTLTDEAADLNSIIQTDSFNQTHQVTRGVLDVRFKEPCWADPASGEVLAQDDQRQPIILAQRPGSGGEVILAGDFQFFDDSGYLDYGDNALLIENMAQVTPAD